MLTFPPFGRILPLFRRILAIPCGMHEILLVAELPKIQVSFFLLMSWLFQAQKMCQNVLCPHWGSLQCLPRPSLVGWGVDIPYSFPSPFAPLTWHLRLIPLSHFYPRDAMLARVIEIATCLSVCLSGCPSRAGIVSKRRKLASWFLHHLVAPRL